MMMVAKALHPIRAGGKIIKPGSDVGEDAVGALRLGRLIAKGRAALPGETAEVNRADTQTGKPDLTLPDLKSNK